VYIIGPTSAREGGPMRRLGGALVVIALSLCLAPAGMAQSAAPAPAGQMTWAVHFTLAPRWLDPAESEGSITPFLALYAGARRVAQANAVGSHRVQPGRVVVGIRRRPRQRFPPPERRQVPRRRDRHRRRREVL